MRLEGTGNVDTASSLSDPALQSVVLGGQAQHPALDGKRRAGREEKPGSRRWSRAPCTKALAVWLVPEAWPGVRRARDGGPVGDSVPTAWRRWSRPASLLEARHGAAGGVPMRGEALWEVPWGWVPWGVPWEAGIQERG